MDRESLETCVDSGMTIRAIAAELNVTTVTVRRWLARLGLRTVQTRQMELAAAARAAGITTLVRSCARHGETEFVLEGRGHYRCKRCRADRVADRRRNMKAVLVAEAGGRCAVCGYDRYVGALQFHHLDPTEKRLEVSTNGSTLSLAALRAEARKCVLLCSNCHAEVENGVTALSIQ